MENYIVYFEIYGKKLKTSIQASDEIHAMEIVKSSISVIKVKKEASKPEKKADSYLDEWEKYFDDLLDLLGKKK